MKKSRGIIGLLLILGLVGMRLYSKFESDKAQKATQQANQEIYTEAQKRQQETEYKAQQELAQKKRDSAFEARKKEQDEQIKQMRENVKKLQEEEKNTSQTN